MSSELIFALVALLAIVAGVIVVRRRRSSLRSYEEAFEPTPARTLRPVPRGEGLGARVRGLFAGRAPGDDDWARLEDLLIRADVGPRAASELVGRIRERWSEGADPEVLLADEIVDVMGPDRPLELSDRGVAVVVVVGVNGSGKTTTIGKLAARLVREGKRVSLAGSDTFRAAASEQLGAWAERAGAHLVSQERGADPGAVAFDAVKSAEARGMDVLIVDTAGRLHTRQPLMDELRKVKRVIEKAHGRVDETLLVLDASTGQNGIAQARAFAEAVGVTGVALAKLDGTAKGGIVLAVREELGVPVKLIGTGEGVSDLERFEARAFAEWLLRG